MEKDVLNRLKSETNAQHRKLESQLDLLREGFTVDDYVALIVRLYGFYLPWEKQAAMAVQEHAPRLLQQRRKAALLASDIRYFSLGPDHAPLCDALPSLATLPEALGSLYVLEGSTLGGQLLVRHFTSTLGLSASSLSFFQGYGDSTGRMWKQFRADLLELSSKATEDAIIASASSTFDCLGAWLAEK